MDTAFYTYLKLFLLSGQTYLDSTSSCRLWAHANTIRTLVDKGNSPPLDDQGGRFNFYADTGTSLKYRKGFGLELQGGTWRSDLQAFEEVWKGRDQKSNDELLEALNLYGEGVGIQSWKTDRITIDCNDWIERRLTVLRKHRDDIQAELDARPASSEQAHDGSIETELGERPEEWSEEGGIPHVISGLENLSAEGESDEIVSPVLRDPLCQVDEPYEQVYEAVIDETEEGDAGQPKTGAEGESTTTPSRDSSNPPSEAKSDIEKSPPTASGGVSGPPRKRTVTALGVVVATVVTVLIFVVGYLMGSGPEAPSGTQTSPDPRNNRPPQDNLGSKPEVDTSGGDTLLKDDPVEEQPIVRAPENPVSLNKLFLRDIEGNSSYSEEDMVIGRQLFPHYIETFGAQHYAVAAYKLDGQFRTLTCIVGVADEDDNDRFKSDSRQILFEGDGKVLKRLEVQRGQAVPVSLQVTGIKVLIITFRKPVVIASPKVHL